MTSLLDESTRLSSASQETVTSTASVIIRCDADVVSARQQACAIGEQLGLLRFDLALVATALLELAHNILSHAGRGEILLRIVQDGARRGLSMVARDEGPGIVDIELALRDGYSTTGSLGLGLPGVRRLMDEFAITSVIGCGTTVAVCKWVRQRGGYDRHLAYCVGRGRAPVPRRG